MQMTSHTHLYVPEAAQAVSVTPCPKLDSERRFGNVLALAGSCAR
jgi:hypothetical protein